MGQQGPPRAVRLPLHRDRTAEWAPKVRVLARDTEQIHALFNNCYRDNAQVNAQRLTELLGE